MPATPAERLQWREDNADLIEFISDEVRCRQSRFIHSMRGSYIQWGSLTTPQTAAARNIMNELTNQAERGIDEAATGQECPHIPNGKFTISRSNWGDHWTFQIYTPRRGPLAGKRIIKRLTDEGYKGFAFLSREGQVRVWRAFYEDEAAGAEYIVAARALVNGLSETHVSTTNYNFGCTHFSVGYDVQASIVCRACNRDLTDPESIRLGIGPDCRRASGEGVVPRRRVRMSDDADLMDAQPIEGLNPHRAAEVAGSLDAILDVLESDEDSPDNSPDVQREVESLRRRLAAPSRPIQQTADAALDDQLVYLLRSRTNEYGVRACGYCGRNDFMQPQGRGRHITSCRERHSNRSLLSRHPERVAQLRENLHSEHGPRIASRNTPRVAVIPAPNLSALGTRISGAVWAQ